MNPILHQFIRQCALEAGFTLCGVARARILEEQKPHLDAWFAAGCDAGMKYLSRHADKRLDPGALLPGAQTVVVCAVNYKNAAWDQWDRRSPGKPMVASYGLARNYHTTVKEMLASLEAKIRTAYPDVPSRGVCDTAPILEKQWAVEAGLGWRGCNSLIITPGHGSFVALGILLLRAQADRYDSPLGGDRCGDCKLCIENCPNGAIRPDRTIDARRCISRMTTQRCPDDMEPDAERFHGWIFGCDVCQTCCPWNRAAPLATLPDFRPVADPAGLDRDFWLSLTEGNFTAIFGEASLAECGFGELRRRILAIGDNDPGSPIPNQK